MTGSSSTSENWKITTPADWPPAPEEMSFSALRQIEACPRQWALLHAHYSHLGTARGYRECTNFSALRGRVVHQALSSVAREFVASGCVGVGDHKAVAVLRRMGGLTAILSRTINEVLASEAGNFRMRAQESSVRLRFVRELPAIRERLQLLLSRLRLEPTAVGRGANSRGLSTGSLSRRIGNGVYHELVLRSRRLGWTGVVDLIEAAESHVQITEFKTSEYSDHHKAQLYTYAVLWRCDERLNPARRIADRLVLSYPQKELSVPQLTPEELSRYEKELAERTLSAREECMRITPRAKPDPCICPRCQVRHLCAEYWTTPTVKNEGDIQSPHTLDCEVQVLAARGPWSWSATVLNTAGLALPDVPQECILYLRGHDPTSGVQIAAGGRYRVLSCHLGAADESIGKCGLLLELTQYSEIFWM